MFAILVYLNPRTIHNHKPLTVTIIFTYWVLVMSFQQVSAICYIHNTLLLQETPGDFEFLSRHEGTKRIANDFLIYIHLNEYFRNLLTHFNNNYPFVPAQVTLHLVFITK